MKKRHERATFCAEIIAPSDTEEEIMELFGFLNPVKRQR